MQFSKTLIGTLIPGAFIFGIYLHLECPKMTNSPLELPDMIKLSRNETYSNISQMFMLGLLTLSRGCRGATQGP